jgi:hypothetical protein
LARSGVADLHANLVSRVINNELEVAVCVAHGIGGELGGHQLGSFYDPVGLVA